MNRHATSGISLLAACLMLAGCETLSGDPRETSFAAELDIVSIVVSDALSGRQEGMLADLRDMMAGVGQHGISYGDEMPSEGDGEVTRDDGYAVVYDPDTGHHTVTYERSTEMIGVSNASQVRLEYLFLDNDGEPRAFPDRKWSEIGTVHLNGERTGQIYVTESRHARLHNFTRLTEWTFVRGDEHNTVATLYGEQVHEGHLEITPAGQASYDRYVVLTMESTDVTLHRLSVEEGRLGQSISGTIHFFLEAGAVGKNFEDEKRFEGTLELDGDGFALVRIRGVRENYLVDILSGEITRRTVS